MSILGSSSAELGNVLKALGFWPDRKLVKPRRQSLRLPLLRLRPMHRPDGAAATDAPQRPRPRHRRCRANRPLWRSPRFHPQKCRWHRPRLRKRPAKSPQHLRRRHRSVLGGAACRREMDRDLASTPPRQVRATRWPSGRPARRWPHDRQARHRGRGAPDRNRHQRDPKPADGATALVATDCQTPAAAAAPEGNRGKTVVRIMASAMTAGSGETAATVAANRFNRDRDRGPGPAARQGRRGAVRRSASTAIASVTTRPAQRDAGRPAQKSGKVDPDSPFAALSRLKAAMEKEAPSTGVLARVAAATDQDAMTMGPIL